MSHPSPLVLDWSAGLPVATTVLTAGDLAIVPTETVYGLVAKAAESSGCQALRRAKGRSARQPLQVLVDSERSARALASAWPPAVAALTAAFWPGPLTVVVGASASAPHWLIADDGSLGLRCPGCTELRQLVATVGPLAASSANRTGAPPPVTCAAAVAGVGQAVALAIDSGPCRLGQASTVVRVVGDSVELLREGALSAQAIAEACGVD